LREIEMVEVSQINLNSSVIAFSWSGDNFSIDKDAISDL
jgi:hypothetical protein